MAVRVTPMPSEELDVSVGPSKTERGYVYVMVYHQTLSVPQTKQLVRKLLAAISEAERVRPCTHVPGMTGCAWCGQQGDDDGR